MIAVVDYHKGNIKSVERGLVAQGADVIVTDDPAVVDSCDAIVLPGVGAFTDAMQTLNELGLSSVIKERIGLGVPFLGICLGLHLMFEGGTEHASKGSITEGLGILPGVVEAMPKRDASGASYKVPHVGWNSVETTSSPLFAEINNGEYFYFTHSFIAPSNDLTIAETKHSVLFPSAVQKGVAFGVQFHPEKSSAAGARLLKNFVDISSQ